MLGSPMPETVKFDEKENMLFEDLGFGFVDISKSDADSLRKKIGKGIAEVVEDIEVFALDITGDADFLRREGTPPFWPRRKKRKPRRGPRSKHKSRRYSGRQGTPLFLSFSGQPFRQPIPLSSGSSWESGYIEGYNQAIEEYEDALNRSEYGDDELDDYQTAEYPLEWNVEMVGAPDVWPRVTGRDVKVAVLDTGIDDDHPALSVYGGISFVPNVPSWNDDQGHGTHCAGIIGARYDDGIIGVAPECSLYAVKVLDSKGRGYLSYILGGMGWAAEQKMDVVSMSLGSTVDTPDAPCFLAYQRAAQRIIDGGGTIVAAAGNSGNKPNPWVGNPARCKGFIAVAAVDENGRHASFSSFGPDDLAVDRGVEIAAPGVSIISTYIDGGYRALSGTSMACPHVAGAVALLKELHPTWSPARIRERLHKTAADAGRPGFDMQLGYGIVDCYQAIYG